MATQVQLQRAPAFEGSSLKGNRSAEMNTTSLQDKQQRLRLLVAIASFGEKNLGFLRKIIQDYRRLPMDVKIIVLSNAPKDLGPEIEVRVGLPSKNPWSLPFAHKPVLAENVEQFDLFVYTEDDIEVTEKHIQAFLEVIPKLDPDELVGYMRYEVAASGEKSVPDVHGPFHWKPESVRRRDGLVTAEFTNEHAGFYILTQGQLRRAIRSGGFLTKPDDGQYGMLETAATDPYTRCGFRRVVCVSPLDNFLVHHMSNRYAGEMGIPLAAFREQVETLVDILDHAHPAQTLCRMDSPLLHRKLAKNFYEKPDAKLTALVPKETKTILSIGCGWGVTEARLQEQGARVTALPLDSVIGAVAARRGIEVIHGTLEQGLASLADRKFDCVVMTNLLHLQPDPEKVLAQCSRFVGDNGTLLLSGPNFNSLRFRVKRALGVRDYRKLRSFDVSGVNVFSPRKLAKLLRGSGFHNATIHLPVDHSTGTAWPGLRETFRSLFAEDWIIQARR